MAYKRFCERSSRYRVARAGSANLAAMTNGFGTGYDENVALRRRLVMQSGRGVMDNLRGFEPRDAGSIPAGRAKKTMR